MGDSNSNASAGAPLSPVLVLDDASRSNLPYAVKSSPELGRYLVATRDIHPLEVIIKEKPIVSGPSDSSSDEFSDAPKCLGCCAQLKEENQYNRCSKCFWPVCNENCEKLKNHAENECIYFAQSNSLYPPPFTRAVLNKCILILRMLLFKYHNLGDEESEGMRIWKRISEMESHTELRKIKMSSVANDEKILANFESFKSQRKPWGKNATETKKGDLSTTAAITSNDKNNNPEVKADWEAWKYEFSNADIVKLSGIIDTNAHVLPQSVKSETTYQIFPESSLLSHDCCPNAEWSIQHSDTNCDSEILLITRATVLIKAGQVINVCYDDSEIMYGTMRRLIPMEIAGLFICKCERCVDPTELGTHFSSIKCPQCRHGYILPRNPVSSFSDWSCNKCPVRQNDEEILDLIQELEDQIEFPRKESIKRIRSNSERQAGADNIRGLELFLNKCSGTVLHPNHFILQEVRLRIIAEESAYLESLSLKRLKGFIEKCRHVMQIANILSPGLSEYRTIVQFHLARGMLTLQRVKEQKLELANREGKNALDSKGLKASADKAFETYKSIYELQKDALSYFKIGNNKWSSVLEKDLEFVKSYIAANTVEV